MSHADPAVNGFKLFYYYNTRQIDEKYILNTLSVWVSVPRYTYSFINDELMLKSASYTIHIA